MGTFDAVAKMTAPSLNGSSSVSQKPTWPSAKMPSTPSAWKTRRTEWATAVNELAAGSNGMAAPKKSITLFRKPLVRSASFGPNQVMRGASGATAVTSSGSHPLWWFRTRQ